MAASSLLALTPWDRLLLNLQYPALVVFAAHLLYVKILFDLMKARYKYRIFAPATSGHPDFDRVFRVQQNFVEHFPTFLASIALCTLFINGIVAATLGTVWVVFRYLHSDRYRREKLGRWVFYYTGPQYAAIGFMYLLSVGRILTHALTSALK